jgi:hypothetical protein
MQEQKCEYKETVCQLFVDFKKAYDSYDSLRKEAVFSILFEFGVPTKRIGLTKMCLNETYRKAGISKYLFDSFPVQNGQLFLNFTFTICHYEGLGGTEIKWDTSVAGLWW